MSVLAHLSSLHEKHTHIKQEIKYAQIHHLPDAYITKLKKLKLQIKDEIQSFSENANSENAA